MASKSKHEQRSHRSHNNKVDYSRFHSNASSKKFVKEQRKLNFADRMKRFIHRVSGK